MEVLRPYVRPCARRTCKLNMHVSAKLFSIEIKLIILCARRAPHFNYDYITAPQYVIKTKRYTKLTGPRIDRCCVDNSGGVQGTAQYF